jgi:hypothetical protein
LLGITLPFGFVILIENLLFKIAYLIDIVISAAEVLYSIELDGKMIMNGIKVKRDLWSI